MPEVNYERELNPQQVKAVSHKAGPALIVAGAGTGKTRTLTYRVAKLVEDGTDPASILLLTFTRRAAEEMLRRAGQLVSDKRVARVAGGTFHAFANGVLRQYGRSIGISPGFTVVDRSDAEDILQHLRTELGFAGAGAKKTAKAELEYIFDGEHKKPKRFPQKQTLMKIISKARNTRTSVAQVIAKEWPQFEEDTEAMVTIARAYETYKRQHNILDYDDLLVALEALLTRDRSAREQLAARYVHIMVDEYQDTNRVQAEILKGLALHKNIVAVGDDAQAIYSFRGADFRNILEFPKDFPGAQIYRIEENYRSTEPILNASNALMTAAKQRHKKDLFSSRGSGPLPRLVGCADEVSQAEFVADEIVELREQGVALEEMAVLFRSSYHSFELEAELARRNIPFVKHGGFKFAEAAHIKDALSLLRWMVNPKDLVAAQRCLLVLEGVGSVAARKIADHVVETGDLLEGLAGAPVPDRAGSGVKELLRALRAASQKETPADQLEALLGYISADITKRFDDAPKRLRDLEHLIGIAKRFKTTEQFTSDFSIDPPADHMVVGVTGVENEEEPLVLSTIHSAKGLEWRAVFVLSVLDGYLPQDYAFGDEAALEEERRMLYVAMTRAKDVLVLTYPLTIIPGNNRSMLRGDHVYGKPSHFLDSVGAEVLEHTVLAKSDLFKTGYLSDILYDE